MKLEPGLLTHPKYLLLERKVGERALKFLIRLWSHCEMNQRGGTWPGADAEYLELVCQWEGPEGELFEAMVKCRFVETVKGGLIIHDWDKMNWRAVSNWNLGHRPKSPRTKSDESQGLSLGLAGVDAKAQPGQSTGLSPTELNELNELNELTDKLPAPQARPTLDDCLRFAALWNAKPARKGPNGEAVPKPTITPEHCADFMSHFEANGWMVSGRYQMRNWMSALEGWARRSCKFVGFRGSAPPKPNPRNECMGPSAGGSQIAAAVARKMSKLTASTP